MELRHLRFFVCLAEELDVASAAKHCGLTPSVLRRHISDLEESLGCSLFRRRGTGVSLSAAGQVFFHRAKELLASAANAVGEVRATAEAMANHVRVGHYGGWWMNRYSSGLKRFSAMHPEVRLQPAQYLPADLAASLRRGEIDLAFMEHVDVGLRIDFKIKRIEVIPSVILLAVDHPLAKRKRVSLKQLDESVWVVWDERVYPGRRHMFLDATAQARILPCIARDAENEEALYEQVIASNAIGYAPQVLSQIPEGIALVNLHPQVLEFPVFLAWRRDSDNIEQLESFAECVVGASG
jgi:DNA-binding transcriptional LysR family regulator